MLEDPPIQHFLPELRGRHGHPVVQNFAQFVVQDLLLFTLPAQEGDFLRVRHDVGVCFTKLRVQASELRQHAPERRSLERVHQPGYHEVRQHVLHLRPSVLRVTVERARAEDRVEERLHSVEVKLREVICPLFYIVCKPVIRGGSQQVQLVLQMRRGVVCTGELRGLAVSYFLLLVVLGTRSMLLAAASAVHRRRLRLSLCNRRRRLCTGVPGSG